MCLTKGHTTYSTTLVALLDHWLLVPRHAWHLPVKFIYFETRSYREKPSSVSLDQRFNFDALV